ncbi:hypothetical protein J6590_070248 [Homalodisca vitripennis]|nr:hypothetical protein J6590_070248 [Homalodisca vitripennis]
MATPLQMLRDYFGAGYSSTDNIQGKFRTLQVKECLNLGTTALQRLRDDYRTTTNGRAGGLLGMTGSLRGTHPSSSHARRWIWLSCYNRCTRCTAPLALAGSA